MMVRLGEADGLIGGLTTHYPDTIRPALQVIEVRPELRRVAGEAFKHVDVLALPTAPTVYTCEQVLAWQAQFPANPPLTLSVNVTPKEFAQPDLAGEIGKILGQIGFNPGNLQLEIIETIAMGDAEKDGRKLAQLKGLGVRLGIDDFGTGYSSLSRLRRIPVDTLKIDRVFISNMDSDPESLEIVKVIIMLAHNLGLKVVAEGTETAEQIQTLQQLNCEAAQGYFYSKPAEAAAISALLAKSNGSRVATAGV
ncbi:MAG: EAL domain-containing protein, partial [Acidobacteriia bacterium]|nr:EAL domain-containing protein [Terriglobia bacterium]